jgi:dolichol-phosphate mannosyltransferase
VRCSCRLKGTLLQQINASIRKGKDAARRDLPVLKDGLFLARNPMNLELSVIVPTYNEAGNIAQLVHETGAALAGHAFELIVVDDGSTDDTAAEALRLRSLVPELRLLRHPQRRGQSAGLVSGARMARAPWIVTLDGDCQNDPRDIAVLLAARSAARDESVQLVMGMRVNRRDTPWRRIQSRVANAVRSRLLGDGTPDTGCGIKLFLRDTFLALPRFDHMHRFLPALFQREGVRVISVPVNHRPRLAGHSKYGMLDRLAAGIVDLVGVMWLIRRRCNSTVQELTEPGPRLPATHPAAPQAYSGTSLEAQDAPS